MCGVLGWISPTLTDPNVARKKAFPALNAMERRGPDGMHMECGNGWLLGHTRLAVLDLTDRARQPMTDGQGGWLVYNGEIYNFKELREELISLGFQFCSTGDTEVLLYALRQWGLDCLGRLRGMFAFGWLDTRKRELILARDRYGVKPLAYKWQGNDFRFASDLFGLRALAGSSFEIDAEAAYLYLGLGYVPAPSSILKGIRKVKPGHYIRLRWLKEDDLKLEERPYWSIKQIPPAESLTDREKETVLKEYEQQVSEAIRYRLISDVPVGNLLSGGIDSTLVTVFSSELSEHRVPNFTMGFTESQKDEVPFASAIAERIGGRHEKFYIAKEDVLKIWGVLWSIYDEPFADSSALPMVALCRLVRNYVKVALSGDGGDEIFCGYPWHHALNFLNHFRYIPDFLRHFLGKTAAILTPTLRYKASVFDQRNRVGQWSALRTGLTDEMKQFLPIEDACRQAPFYEYFRTWSGEVGNITDPLDWACRMDLLTYLPDDLMVKADRASMNVGLELRAPFLDHRLSTWCLQIPILYRYNKKTRTSKFLSRQLLEQRIPRQLFNRPKQGFTPPLDQWLHSPLMPAVQDALNRLKRGELAPLRLNYKDWPECAAKLNDQHHQFLWRVVCFSEWIKHVH